MWFWKNFFKDEGIHQWTKRSLGHWKKIWEKADSSEANYFTDSERKYYFFHQERFHSKVIWFWSEVLTKKPGFFTISTCVGGGGAWKQERRRSCFLGIRFSVAKTFTFELFSKRGFNDECTSQSEFKKLVATPIKTKTLSQTWQPRDEHAKKKWECFLWRPNGVMGLKAQHE